MRSIVSVLITSIAVVSNCETSTKIELIIKVKLFELIFKGTDLIGNVKDITASWNIKYRFCSYT